MEKIFTCNNLEMGWNVWLPPCIFELFSISEKPSKSIFFLSDIWTAVYLWVGSHCCQGVQIPHVSIISRNDTSDCGTSGLNLSDCINTRNDTIKRWHAQSSWLFQENSSWQLLYIYSLTAIFNCKKKKKTCHSHKRDWLCHQPSCIPKALRHSW